MLDLAEYKPHHERLLDLCGGTGVVCREAIHRGGSDITLLDLNPRYANFEVCAYAGRAEDAGVILLGEKYDVITLRQALGYVNLERTFAAVASLMEANSRFAFNSFTRPAWRVKRYTHNDQQFIEASGYIGKHVVHMQANLFGGVDFTHFIWHTIGDIESALAKHFVWVRHDDGPSIRWLARKAP